MSPQNGKEIQPFNSELTNSDMAGGMNLIAFSHGSNRKRHKAQ